MDLDGLAHVDDVVEHVPSLRLHGGRYETLAGYVVAALGRIPHTGDVVHADGHRLLVLRMQGHRVSDIRVEP